MVSTSAEISRPTWRGDVAVFLIERVAPVAQVLWIIFLVRWAIHSLPLI